MHTLDKLARAVKTYMVGTSAIATVLVGFAAPAFVRAAQAQPNREGSEEAQPAPVTDAEFLALYPGAGGLRLPTEEEKATLGILWPDVPPEKNAAYYFVKAGRMVRREGEPPGSYSSAEPYDGNVAAFREWVTSNRPALDVMRQGMRMAACGFPAFISDERKMPDVDLAALAQIRHLARCAADAGFLAEVEGKPDEAADMYLACIRMGSQVRTGGPLIVSLVGIAVTSMGQSQLDGLIANTPPSDAALRRIIEECRSAETAPNEIAESWEREAAFGKAIMRSNPELYASPLRKPTLAGYEAFAASLARRDVDLFQAKARDAMLKRDLGGSPLLSLLAPAFGRWAEELGTLDVRLRETQIRAGIALYRKQHGGRPPQSLEVLSPAFLPNESLIDPFSRNDFRYSGAPDGWRLWSVGPDNVDDGGTAPPVHSGRGRRGPDYVFTHRVPSNIDRRSGALRAR